MGDFRGFKLAEIEKDRSDLRDSIYTPSLRSLPRCLNPPLELRPVISSLVRDQLKQNSGDFQSSCAAQALCSVIDIFRIRDGGWAWDFRNPKVSAEMLYRCAREIEAAERGKNAPMEGLRSLRSAIKAVYHNGVCTELEWAANDEVGRARRARNIPLGAYYRLRSVLNDYHVALNDVGAIYAAADIDDGRSLEARSVVKRGNHS